MKFCPQCDTGYPDDATACPIHAVVLIEMRDLRPGLLIANTYRIFRKLGQGARGSVYLAENAHTDQPQVLRFLTAELSRNVAFMSRYQRTARTLSQIQQKNIISSGVLETAEDGSLFFAMDFVDGPSLRELMNMAPGPFDVGLSLAIARCIAEGLGAAHTAGIVHRDIKPENILIASEGEVLAPKIANFGMGVIKQNGSAFQPSAGTVLASTYAAPEQWLDAKSAELDGRTDLYSLGAILFEMLTGEALFHANDFEDWALHRLIPVPRRPSDLRPDLAAWNGLDQLALSLLATKQQDRPKDSAEVLRRLDAVQFGTSIPATPSVSVTEAPSAVLETPPVVMPETDSPVLETPPASVVDVVEPETQPPARLEEDSNAAAELPDPPIPMDAAMDAEEVSEEALQQESYFGTHDKEEDVKEVSAEALKQQSYFGSRAKEEKSEENPAEAPSSFSADSMSTDAQVARREIPEVLSFSGSKNGAGSKDTAEGTEEKSGYIAEPPSFFSRILARGKTRPLPTEIPEVSSFFGSNKTREDTEEKPADAVDPSTFFSRLPARSDAQALSTETSEVPSFPLSGNTLEDIEEKPAAAADFQGFIRHDPMAGHAQAPPRETPEQPSFSRIEGTGKDIEQKPGAVAEFQDFIRRDPMGSNAQAVPRKTSEQPSLSGSLERRNDILFKPRGTDDLESFFRREYMGPGPEEGDTSATEPPSFIGGAETSKDAGSPPKNLADLPNWLRRVQPEKGSRNEPKRATEPPSHLSGVDEKPKWEADSVAESPSVYDAAFAGRETKAADWVATGVPSVFGHANTARDTAEIPPLDAESPTLFAPVDAPWDMEEEDGQTGEILGPLEAVGSSLPEPEPYANYEEPVEDELQPKKSLRVIWMVAAAVLTLAALGFAIWRSGPSNPIQPTSKLADACDAGDAKACSDLAAWFEKTNTVADGDSRAAAYYSKACDGALPLACRKLGLKYLLGEGIARDTPRALQLLSKACDQGDYEGCDILADIYHEGKGVNISDRKAAALYSKACAAGDEFGCKWAKKLAAATRSAKPTAKPYVQPSNGIAPGSPSASSTNDTQ
jgi:serine/threonine protein kinase